MDRRWRLSLLVAGMIQGCGGSPTATTAPVQARVVQAEAVAKADSAEQAYVEVVQKLRAKYWAQKGAGAGQRDRLNELLKKLRSPENAAPEKTLKAQKALIAEIDRLGGLRQETISAAKKLTPPPAYQEFHQKFIAFMQVNYDTLKPWKIALEEGDGEGFEIAIREYKEASDKALAALSKAAGAAGIKFSPPA